MKTVVRGKKMTEICSIIHKCTIHGEKKLHEFGLQFSFNLSAVTNRQS